MFFATLTLILPLAAIPPAGMSRVTSGPSADAALPMPPPPTGMKPLSPEEKAALLDQAGADPDSASDSEEIEEESADLEAMHALEEVALDPEAGEDALILQTVQSLGPSNPLRQRLEDVLQDDDHREEAPPELGPITDLLAFDVSRVKDRYDIPVEMQPLVAEYIRFFQGPGRRWFRKWMNRSTRFIPVMQPILEQAGVPKDLVYLAMIESGFSSQAYSWARAAGPWQFIAGTGKTFGLDEDFWVDERRDPIKSTRAAAKYLKQLYQQLGHWYLAWAGYNTGGGRVRRVCERKGTTDFWEISEGKGLAKETRHYVPKLIAAALIAKNPRAFGFEDEEFDFQPPLEFDTVEIPDLTDLTVIARAAGTTEDTLRDLNPELKRWCTPPASEEHPYLLRIPKGHAEQFAENFARIPKKARMAYVEHKVKKGDTLSVIAQRHGTSTEAIMRFNGLRSARSLRINSTLIIPVPMRSGSRLAQARDAEPQRELRPAAHPPVRRATPVLAGAKIQVHTIQAGETLWSVAQRYDVTVAELKRWNGISNHRTLRVGQKLRIARP